MSTETTGAPIAPSTETAPAGDTPTPSAMDRALDAMTRAPASPPDATAPPPAAPPPAAEPPKAPAIDAEALRRTQEKAHADVGAKLERERREIDDARKALDADRRAVGEAQRLARLAKDDPARFLRETGHDAVDFAKRLAERERVTDATRAEFERIEAETTKTRAELDALKAAQAQAQTAASDASRAQAVAQLRSLARGKHTAAAHYLDSSQMDPGYLDALADEMRAEAGYVTLDGVAERLDLRMREAFRTMLETPWGREMATGSAPRAPATTTAPTSQEPQRTAAPPKTLSRSVTDDRSSAPQGDRETRMERALDLMMGRTSR